jgi:hypothetical protein
MCTRRRSIDTKRARFFAPESRERRETCVFEFLKKRRKKIQKKFKNTHKRSLVLTTAEDTSTLERLLSS